MRFHRAGKKVEKFLYISPSFLVQVEQSMCLLQNRHILWANYFWSKFFQIKITLFILKISLLNKKNAAESNLKGNEQLLMIKDLVSKTFFELR